MVISLNSLLCNLINIEIKQSCYQNRLSSYNWLEAALWRLVVGRTRPNQYLSHIQDDSQNDHMQAPEEDGGDDGNMGSFSWVLGLSPFNFSVWDMGSLLTSIHNKLGLDGCVACNIFVENCLWACGSALVNRFRQKSPDLHWVVLLTAMGS